MRTMHISLILICSLAQLASADRGTPVQRDEFKECSDLYTCVVPQFCTVLVDFNRGTVEVVKEFHLIYPDCPAAIRIHLYANHHAHIIMEGLKDSTKSIEFIRKGKLNPTDLNDPSRKAIFNCTVNDEGLLYGGYSIDLIKGNKETLKFVRTHEDPHKKFERKSRIKCEFEIKLGKSYDIFTKFERDTVQFHIDKTEKTKPHRLPDPPVAKCNPSNIKFLEEDKERKNKYEKVTYHPGKFYCSDKNNFKMQYKKNDGTQYETIKELICHEDLQRGWLFQVKDSAGKTVNSVDGDSDYDGNDDLRIRCLADVNLFCDESPMVKGSDGPNFKAPDRKNSVLNKRVGSLTCPPSAPHLVVKGIDKPIQHAKFECLAFGAEQFWTVSVSKAQTIRLTMDGPEVECTNILKCHLQLRIPESSVMGGDLDAKTYVPKCSENGILFARQEGDKNVEIETPYCNNKTGAFEYKVKGGSKEVITNSTKFECTYPLEKDENMNMGAAQAAGYSAIAVGIAAAIGGAIIGLMFVFAARKRRLVKEKQKQQEQKEKEIGESVWIRYCMDDEEKKKIEEKMGGGKLEEGTPKDNDEIYNWNRMLMNFQRNGMESLGVIKDGDTVTNEKAIQTFLNEEPLKKDVDGHYSHWLITNCDYVRSKTPLRAVEQKIDVYRYEGELDEPKCTIQDEVEKIELNMTKKPNEVKYKVDRRKLMKYAPQKTAGR